MNVTSQFEEADAVEALTPARDQCAQSVLEFMAACGVRITTAPPQLLEVLTAYGFHAVGIGRALAHGKRPLAPESVVRPTGNGESKMGHERSGVHGKFKKDAPAGEGSQPTARDSDATRRIVRPLTRNG